MKTKQLIATITDEPQGTAVQITTESKITIGEAENIAISILLANAQATPDKSLIEYLSEVATRAILTDASQP